MSFSITVLHFNKNANINRKFNDKIHYNFHRHNSIKINITFIISYTYIPLMCRYILSLLFWNFWFFYFFLYSTGSRIYRKLLVQQITIFIISIYICIIEWKYLFVCTSPSFPYQHTNVNFTRRRMSPISKCPRVPKILLGKAQLSLITHKLALICIVSWRFCIHTPQTKLTLTL